MHESLSSKQRVLKAFAHEEPDRVPIGYAANPEVNQALRAYYGLGEDVDELRAALGVDFRWVDCAYVGPRRHQPVEDRRIDEFGIRTRWVEHESGGYWDYCDWPLRDATFEEIDAWPLPEPDDYDYSKIADYCDRYADFCIVAGGAGIGDTINHTGMLRTMDQVLVDLLTEDPAGLHLIDRKHEAQYAMLERVLETADGKIDLMCMGEDLGTQRGPTIGLELFRKQIRPRLQKFVNLAKRFDVPVMIHSCGSSSWAFEDFVEMGIRVVDTLQPEAKDMAPAYLKDRFGEKLAFHGMISTAGPVAYGKVDEVVRNVKETLAVMMPGGGYALAPTHCLQANSPVENVVAMYETAREFGRYGS